MDVGHVIVADGGVLEIQSVPEPGIRFFGHLWVIGTGRVTLAYSVIQFMNTYHGQYHLAGIDQAEILIEGCTYRVPNGVQHGLTIAGQGHLTVRESDFGDVQLTAAQSGVLDASRLNGHFEVILQDQAQIRLTDIPRTEGDGNLWPWTEHPAGCVAEFSPPMPGFVAQWTFPPAEAEGIPQRLNITRCEVLLWPTLVYPDAEVRIRDVSPDNWVLVGFHLPRSVTITGIRNDTYVADDWLPLRDRSIHLENAQVDTWNFYAEEHAHIVMRDSLFGEALAFDTSTIELHDCVVDGSGGYFGAQDQAYVSARRCAFTCDVQAIHESVMLLDHCEVAPRPIDPDGSYTRIGAYDSARLGLNQTPVSITPALGGSGAIFITWISAVDPWPPQRGVPTTVSGSVAWWAAGDGPTLKAWKLFARPGSRYPMKSTIKAQLLSFPVAQGAQSVWDDVLGAWVPESAGGLLAATTLHFEISDSAGHVFFTRWPMNESDVPPTNGSQQAFETGTGLQHPGAEASIGWGPLPAMRNFERARAQLY